jgi:predicted nucleic acid-binding protein
VRYGRGMATRVVAQRELRNNYNALLREAESGTEIIVTDRGRPFARQGAARHLGAHRSPTSLARLTRVRETLSAVPVDEAVTHAYALLVAQARDAGRNPRVMDTLIAATARAHGLTLITRDVAQAELNGVDPLMDPSAS